MSITFEQIERQVLALPVEDRAQLVDKLWDSLGDTTYPVLGEAWKTEIERRRTELQDRIVKAVPGADVSRRAWKLAEEHGA